MNVEEMFKKDSSESSFGEQVENPAGNPEKEDVAPTQEGEDTALVEKVAPSTNKRFKKLIEEREELAEKLTELEQFKKDVEAGRYSQATKEDIPPEWNELFGENSEKAWNVNKKLLEKMGSQIEEKLKEKLAQEKQQEELETKKWENYIDEQLATLEEEKGIDLTSNSAQAKKMRSELRQIIEDYSPNDSWIPFEKAYEIYELKKGKPQSSTPLKKEIAGRSMSKSSGSVIEPVEVGEGSWREKYFPGQH